ncbi:ABC transporter ATP-binding protein [Rhodococcus sp. 077-4]|uniref:ABC transporter ATP-binding protein n=1 Tax=Rhodococcus sp. 077-4 TaxID=2789271 RepID=UPI0039F55911
MSVEVRAGEHWAVLGPNGAGKSTLLSLFGALQHPTRGAVHILGRRLGRVDMRELRELIGHVDPRHRLDQPLSALEVVLTGLTNTVHLVPRRRALQTEHDRAVSLLDVMGMSERRHAPWTKMSQGERGRVLIARALMSSPSLLLLDEPATGLDLAAREQLLEALAHMRQEVPSLATVMVTHHLEELPPITSHALLMNSGRVQAAGVVDSILTSESISTCFEYPVSLVHSEGRWNVRASGAPWSTSTASDSSVVVAPATIRL